MSLPDPVTLLDELEPVLGARGSEPQALDGGITNRNYRVVMGGEDYVLRICGKDTSVLGIDRDAECEATMAAARIGVGPRSSSTARTSRCCVTRWVEGRVATAEELRSAPVLEQVAACAARRRMAGRRSRRSFDAFVLVGEYRDEILARGGRVPPATTRPRRRPSESRASPGPTTSRSPCHNDLLTANFLFDGDSVRIVDWEYAGMGDRFFDLGNLGGEQRPGRATTNGVSSPPTSTEIRRRGARPRCA